MRSLGAISLFTLSIFLTFPSVSRGGGTQNVTSPYAPPANPYRYVSPNPNNYPDGYWRFWGTSLGSPAVTITQGITTLPETTAETTAEATLRSLYVGALFSNQPGALGLNMARFTIAGGYNPDFLQDLTPLDFDKLGLIKDIPISTTDSAGTTVTKTYRVLTQSLNRGTCDINDNPEWISYQRSSDPKPVPLYCNINTADPTANKSIDLQLSDIQLCYQPDLFNSWGGGPASFLPATESASDTRNGNHHERQLLLDSVRAIEDSGNPTKVETESMLAPYYVMDSQCQSGHNYLFSNPPTGQPTSIYDAIDSISKTGGAQAFGTYIGQVVNVLNQDLLALNPHYPLHVTDVEPYNGPIHYQSALSDSGPTSTTFNGSWTIPTLLSLFPDIKSSLNAQNSTVGLTGFDEDKLGDIIEYPEMENRPDGGTGTFFMLLQDRDTNQSAVLNSLDYVSAHPFTGILLRELLAIARDAHKPITVTGDGCCVGPGTWGVTDQSIESPGYGPWVYPPGAYPSASDYGTQTTGRATANQYWLGVDKYAYVMREMIKYMGASAWHFLSSAWGLFNVVNGEVRPQATYYAIREFVHAIPPESLLVKVDDDNMLAATYHDTSGNNYLSLIIYNGIFAKTPPTACPQRFPCANRPADSFAGLTTIKSQPQTLYYKIDLSQFDVAAGTVATVRMLGPDSSDLGRNSTTVCPSNTTVYSLQANPPTSSTWYYPGQDANVNAPLYYGGCNVQQAKNQVTGAIVPDIPSWKMAVTTLNDNLGAATGHAGLAIDVPPHAVFFINIPLKTAPPLVPISQLTTIDDSKFANSTNGNWKQLQETSFQYYSNMTKKAPADAVTDSQIYGAVTYNHTYSETTVGGAAMTVNFGKVAGPPARIRVFGVQRPTGGLAHVTLDYASHGPEYTFSTYGEYWMGQVLLYDSGNLSAAPHELRIYNYDGQALTIDKIETSDPDTTVQLN